jgi:hypothetical protein
MNGVAFRTAGRYLGAWGAIVLFVVLLSLLFTFLGTITCAVLAGMMMGAFKGAKWFSVSVSLVFPGVIFGMARGAKVELTPQQIALLAVLCFGTFWVTYLVSAFVFFCEQKGKKPSKLPAPAPLQETLARGGQVCATDCDPVAKPLGSRVPARESCLEQLQGNWVCEASSAGEPLCKKVIQIKEAKLELKTIDDSGRITLLASGDVTLQSSRPSQTLFIPQRASEPADFIVGL